MQSLTNQKSNRTASRVTTWWMVFALAAGCLERVAVEPVAVEPVSNVAPSSPPTSPSKVEPFDSDLDLLLERLRDRLSLMPAVARYKWAHGLPIEDAARERSLADRFVTESQSRGLDADWSRRVIVAQITAARRVQQDCFESWRSSPPDESDPILDLQTDLRPRIERVTAELIEILVRLEPHRPTAAFRAAFPARTDSLITRQAVSDEVRHLAIAPWSERVHRTDSIREP